jgi:hypothetical protein
MEVWTNSVKIENKNMISPETIIKKEPLTQLTKVLFSKQLTNIAINIIISNPVLALNEVIINSFILILTLTL